MMDSCEHYEEKIIHSLNGELEAKEAKLLRKHLAGCEGCRKLEEEYRFLANAAARAPLAPVREETSERIRRAVLSSFPKEEFRQKRTEKGRGLRGFLPRLFLHPLPAYQFVILAAALAALFFLGKGEKKIPLSNRNEDSMSAAGANKTKKPEEARIEEKSPRPGERKPLWTWKGREFAQREEPGSGEEEEASLWSWGKFVKIRGQ